MRRFVVLLTTTVFVAVGCAQTYVKKNPGDHNKGIRYYRPKPYLLVQPTKGESKELVSISLEYLPDFSEEYSISVRAGIGKNATKITLKDGWNLTQIDQDLDSQTDENINAIASLLKSVAPGGLIPSAGPGRSAPMIVPANNVPLGYYESVINRDPSGRKQLYGFRYIGFMPFAPCPLDVQGKLCADCQAMPIFGLVMVKGVMTFVPLQSAERPDLNWVPNPAAATEPNVAPAPAPTTSLPSPLPTREENIQTAVVPLANELLAQSLGKDRVRVSPPSSDREVTITLVLSRSAKRAIETSMGAQVQLLKTKLEEIVRQEHADNSFKTKLDLVEQ